MKKSPYTMVRVHEKTKDGLKELSTLRGYNESQGDLVKILVERELQRLATISKGKYE